MNALFVLFLNSNETKKRKKNIEFGSIMDERLHEVVFFF